MASAMTSSDRQFRPMLLAIAGTYLGCFIAIAVTTGGPGALGGVIVNAVLIAGLVAFGLALARQHAYTRAGRLLFARSVAAWAVVLAVVMQLSIRSGWWSTTLDQYQRSWHFVLSAAVSVVPLLIGAWLVGRRR